MKKIIMVFLFLICTRVMAFPFNKLVFFGDSLTDNGNIYQLLFKIVPKSPPYFKGRFTNGPNWAEYLGKHYYEKYYMEHQIYAMGGATALFELPTIKFISPTTLDLEVSDYLFTNFFYDKSKTLFVFWIGGNDYLYNTTTKVEEFTTSVTEKIGKCINRLIQSGAKSFLVLNLPDISQTPYARHEDKNRLHQLSIKNNEKLSKVIDRLREKNNNATFLLVDINAILKDVMVNPDYYNTKYKAKLVNFTDACWQGGYLLHNDSGRLEREIELAQQQSGADKKIDVKEVSKFIKHSPSMSLAYEMGQAYMQGIRPCANPDGFLFWDQMHPTAIVHRVLAEIIIEKTDHAFGFVKS